MVESLRDLSISERTPSTVTGATTDGANESQTEGLTKAPSEPIGDAVSEDPTVPTSVELDKGPSSLVFRSEAGTDELEHVDEGTVRRWHDVIRNAVDTKTASLLVGPLKMRVRPLSPTAPHSVCLIPDEVRTRQSWEFLTQAYKPAHVKLVHSLPQDLDAGTRDRFKADFWRLDTDRYEKNMTADDLCQRWNQLIDEHSDLVEAGRKRGVDSDSRPVPRPLATGTDAQTDSDDYDPNFDFDKMGPLELEQMKRWGKLTQSVNNSVATTYTAKTGLPVLKQTPLPEEYWGGDGGKDMPGDV